MKETQTLTEKDMQLYLACRRILSFFEKKIKDIPSIWISIMVNKSMVEDLNWDRLFNDSHWKLFLEGFQRYHLIDESVNPTIKTIRKYYEL